MKGIITDFVILREHLTKLIVFQGRRISKCHERMNRLEARIRELEKKNETV